MPSAPPEPLGPRFGDIDETHDVVGVLAAHIEQRFAMSMDELTAAVMAAPDANPQATEVVRWHQLLVQAQTTLEQAEDDLLAALETQPSEVDDPTLALAHRVNVAVTARDGRAMVVRWLLDPDSATQQRQLGWRPERFHARTRQGPAVITSPPVQPAGPAPAAPSTTSGVRR